MRCLKVRVSESVRAAASALAAGATLDDSDDGCAVLRASCLLAPLDGGLGRLQAVREPRARGGRYYGPPVAHVE